MRPRSLATALLLSGVLCAPASAASYEDAETGYRAQIPASWRYKYKPESGELLLKAGNLLLTVEAQVSRSLGKGDILGSYRRDGGSLKQGYGAVKILQTPKKASGLGTGATYQYGFAYRPPGEGIHNALAWMGAGDSKESGKRLLIKVLARGDARLFQQHKAELAAFLRSFRWPEAPKDDGEDGPEPTRPSTTVSPPEPRPTQVATTTDYGGSSGSDDGYGDDGDDLSDLQRPREGEFDRGSFSGGRGDLDELTVDNDAAFAARVARGMGARDRARDAEQRGAAAARLGFNTPDNE